MFIHSFASHTLLEIPNYILRYVAIYVFILLLYHLSIYIFPSIFLMSLYMHVFIDITMYVLIIKSQFHFIIIIIVVVYYLVYIIVCMEPH